MIEAVILIVSVIGWGYIWYNIGKLAVMCFSRDYWERRAAKLQKHQWHVGRTDIYSYVEGGYVHYAYPPDGAKEARIPFFGSPTSALRKAVKYAESKNRHEHSS